MFFSRRKVGKKEVSGGVTGTATHHFRDFTHRYFRPVHVIDTFRRSDWANVMLASVLASFFFRQGNKISLTAGRSTTSVRYHNGCWLLPPCEYFCLAISGVFCFSLYTCYFSSFLLYHESEFFFGARKSLWYIYLNSLTMDSMIIGFVVLLSS